MPDPTLSGGVSDEWHLIRRASEGDHGAFRCLVERHMKRAYSIAYSFVNDHHRAEEIAQETFVRVYQSLGSFRGDAEFGTWLYRIVTNLSLNSLKQVRRMRVHRSEQSIDDITTGDNTPARGDDIAPHIERALHELPTLQRATVILRHLDGLSTKQVSRILHCSEGTVKTHLFRGMAKLRKKLDYLKDGDR